MIEQNGDYTTAIAPETLRIERVVKGPIERVWAYLTEPDKRALWFAGGAMELRPGGKCNLIFHNSQLSRDDAPPPPSYAGKGAEFHMPGIVTVCEPPRRLSFTFGADADTASEAAFELSPQGTDVRLVITHRRLGKHDERISVATGWHTHLALLEAELADEPAPKFWATFTRLEPEYRQRIA